MQIYNLHYPFFIRYELVVAEVAAEETLITAIRVACCACMKTYIICLQVRVSNVLTQTPSEWKEMYDMNVSGLLNGMQAVLPSMIERKTNT
ncbi:hypothetical protein [Bacillus wiedmannii]|uniref:hypothetical protein n=1 Tax=Bacillus wiedmannii TaxID=1890302 RepID=UPI00159BD011|nr:hypothetical protein [Bacillus wiedmannii]MDR4943209.1 hypothetical protein [Bacillus wiedmannii]